MNGRKSKSIRRQAELDTIGNPYREYQYKHYKKQYESGGYIDRYIRILHPDCCRARIKELKLASK